MAQSGSEARAHHFVPQCWLAGFTDSGEKDGRLWVTDLKRKRAWQSTPVNTGHRRDFNRIDRPNASDPLVAERALGDVENQVAPILKVLNREVREPSAIERDYLLEFMALQFIRTPSFRATIDRTVDAKFQTALSNEENWERALRENGIPLDRPDVEYSTVKASIQKGEPFYSGDNLYYLLYGAKFAEDIAATFRARYWNWIIDQRGGFIGSDNPVGLDGPGNGPMGFNKAVVVVYPVCRHLLMCGFHHREPSRDASRKLVAKYNTFAMLGADEQVYSHKEDFEWLDERDERQRDWKWFDREKIVRSGRR